MNLSIYDVAMELIRMRDRLRQMERGEYPGTNRMTKRTASGQRYTAEPTPQKHSLKSIKTEAGHLATKADKFANVLLDIDSKPPSIQAL